MVAVPCEREIIVRYICLVSISSLLYKKTHSVGHHHRHLLFPWPFAGYYIGWGKTIIQI